jgi:phage gp29-like protein
MVIEIIESTTTGTNAQVYQGLAEWVDKELSKLVLGQTASAEGTPGALGGQPGQEAVRQDICKADALQFEQTINRDLVIPYVRFNFGDQAACPKIKTKLVESKNIQLIVDSVAKLAPLGLKVKSSEMRELLTLSAPAEDDEILEQPSMAGGMPEMNAAGQSLALNAAETGDSFEAEPSDGDEDGYVRITDEIVDVLEKAMDRATDFKSFEKELEKLAVEWPAEKIAELLAVATFRARVKGAAEFEK